MNKQTVVDQVTIDRNGNLNIRLAKQIVDDDGTVLASEWHRASVPPGGNIDAVFSSVNENLVKDLKQVPVEKSEIDWVKSINTVAIEDYKQKILGNPSSEGG